MEFFVLDTLADHGAGDFCFSNNSPDGIGLKSYRLSGGMPLSKDYPEDPWEVGLKLGADYPGLKLPSFVGNTGRLMIVHRDIASAIQDHDVGEIEVLPFTLYDHKQRVYSRDYVFLNPLGEVDCINYELSKIEYSKKGKIQWIEKLVLDKKKAKGYCDLFRPKGKSNMYIFSEKLVDKLKYMHSSNFFFEKLAQG